MPNMLTADETTFRSRVLRAPLPALVCFSAPGCPATQAMRPALERQAARMGGLLAVVDAPDAQAIAEQYGVASSPTLLAFRHGAEVLRSVGFLPEPLLALLCDDAARARGESSRLWMPLEDTFEDVALLPLLDALELGYTRQQRCVNWPSARGGRIDVLIHDERGAVSLVESKRIIRSPAELAKAAQQAHSYARAMGLPSFVVAAPGGLWVYALRGQSAALYRSLSWIELEADAQPLRETLFALQP